MVLGGDANGGGGGKKGEADAAMLMLRADALVSYHVRSKKSLGVISQRSWPKKPIRMIIKLWFAFLYRRGWVPSAGLCLKRRVVSWAKTTILTL